MRRITAFAVSLSVGTLMAGTLWADTPIVSGLDFALGSTTRTGTAINSSGTPGEADAFNLFEVGGFTTIPLGPQWRLQLEASTRDNDIPAVIGGFFSDDSSTRSGQFGLQLGYATQDWYLGAFGAWASTRFTNFDTDQNARTEAVGLAAAYHRGDWMFAAQAGVLNARAPNPEVMDDGRFAALNAVHFLNQGQTAIGARIAVADGDQDTDSGSGPDDIDLLEIGLFIEHGLDRPAFGGQASLFAELNWLDVVENRSGGGTQRAQETQISLGMRIVFGAPSVQARSRATAPRLPDFGRWQGLVPIVD